MSGWQLIVTLCMIAYIIPWFLIAAIPLTTFFVFLVRFVRPAQVRFENYINLKLNIPQSFGGNERTFHKDIDVLDSLGSFCSYFGIFFCFIRD